MSAGPAGQAGDHRQPARLPEGMDQPGEIVGVEVGAPPGVGADGDAADSAVAQRHGVGLDRISGDRSVGLERGERCGDDPATEEVARGLDGCGARLGTCHVTSVPCRHPPGGWGRGLPAEAVTYDAWMDRSGADRCAR